MSYSKILKAITSITILGAVGLFSFVGCQGDTDGGSANDELLGPGPQPVSDGGFGASLTIQLSDGTSTLQTAERKGFFVIALDPSGAPLAFRRVFCESEHGIAILEPSSGGVAFEHTGPDGSMSGVLGGVTPGSYLLECRLEEGFNLVARKRLKVEGDVPEGFSGFEGAAGGNLGGGSIQENPESNDDADDGDTDLTSIGFTGEEINGTSSNGPIDIVQNLNCDGITQTNDAEDYGLNNFALVVDNNLDQNIVFSSVTFEVNDGRGVESTQQVNVVADPGNSTISGSFTEFVSGTNIKSFAGTAFTVQAGTYDVTFTIRGRTESGNNVRISGGTSVTFADVNNCS